MKARAKPAGRPRNANPKKRSIPAGLAAGRVQTTMRMSSSLLADLDKIATRQGVTRSYLVEQTLLDLVRQTRPPVEEDLFS